MIYDLHNDLFTSTLSEFEQNSFVEENSKVNLILAIWTSRLKNPLEFIKKRITNYSNFSNVQFAIEDLFFANEKNLDDIAKLNIKYCTLAWSENNCVAGGHLGNSGLTKFGKKVIKKLALNNISIDTAHLNEKSFYEVFDETNKIINSHTCLNSIYKHSRNLSDRQIKMIINAGGIIGISAVSTFMKIGSASRADYLAQLISYGDKFGVESLCIGTDLFGTEPLEGLKDYTYFDALRYDLEKSGYTTENIDKIMYKNAQKYFTKL